MIIPPTTKSHQPIQDGKTRKVPIPAKYTGVLSFTARVNEAVTAVPGGTGNDAAYSTNLPLLAGIFCGVEHVVGLMQKVRVPSPDAALMVADSVSEV